jgi:PPOX class probable F420-dependent enzyme
MTPEEWRRFLLAGSRTGKLATVRPDGRPNVVPIWFTLEGSELLFTTGERTLKARNLRANPAVAVSVDEESFPYAFVLVEGRASLEALPPPQLLPWTTRIAERYVGNERAAAYGRRNAVDGELLVRVAMTRVVARKGIAD